VVDISAKVCFVNDMLSTLGERTLWHNIKDGLKIDFIPLSEKEKTNNYELIIQNSIWGRINKDIPTISLVQDNYFGLQRYYGPGHGCEQKLNAQWDACKEATKIIYNTNYMSMEYKTFGKGEVIPLGIDHNLFKPKHMKK